ncbi:MAG: hypothetical protein U0790_03590 [Isosphaeraceae bacterium]
MESMPGNPEVGTDLLPQNIIRVETALSRFPIHNLGTKSNVGINIREKDQDGEVKVRWLVKHQPGPLAYKLDTLIVNRRIEEASRPVPKVIRLGSLRQICRDLGISEGKGTQNVKDAIYQNAEAFIKAKTKYKLKDGGERTIEAGFNRYSVIFTGEELPDGKRADAVYIVLNDVYIQVLNGAMTRPLDYDYLRGLPPAPQRFYEILSYQMFAALKHNRPSARLVYSEFCTYAPQTRYADYERVKKQMYKVHAPHRKSGYIKAVEFEDATDSEGQPDWVILYTPGPKARAEYRAFTKRGGPVVIEIEQPTTLEQELAKRGVTERVARELVAEFPEERIRLQLEVTDWKHEKGQVNDRGAFLVAAIRDNHPAPDGFETKAQRTEKANDEARKKREEANARRLRERERAAHARMKAFWDGLTPEEQEALDVEALEAAPAAAVEEYNQNKTGHRSIAQAMFRAHIRDPYIRAKLSLHQEAQTEGAVSQPSLFD